MLESNLKKDYTRQAQSDSPPAKGEYPKGEGVFPLEEATTPPFGHPSLAGGEFECLLTNLYLSSSKVPWRGGSVRSGRFDCLTEPGIVGGIVAARIAPHSRPARNDSALRGPRGSFEAVWPDRPAPSSSNQTLSCAFPPPKKTADFPAVLQGCFLYAASDQHGVRRLSPVISTGFSIPRIPRMVGATSARRPSRTLKSPGPT